MPFGDVIRTALESPIEAHPTLEFVRCWSRCWLPVEIDLLSITRIAPPHIDHHETSMVEPNVMQTARLITGLRLHVEPTNVFWGWRARIVLKQHQQHQRLIVDELIVGCAMGQRYTPLYPAKRIPPMLVDVETKLSFVLQPSVETPPLAAAVKLDIFGFELLEKHVEAARKACPPMELS